MFEIVDDQIKTGFVRLDTKHITGSHQDICTKNQKPCNYKQFEKKNVYQKYNVEPPITIACTFHVSL